VGQPLVPEILGQPAPVQVQGPPFVMTSIAIKKVNHFCTWRTSINVAFQLGIYLLAKDKICRKRLPSSPCIL